MPTPGLDAHEKNNNANLMKFALPLKDFPSAKAWVFL